MCNYVRKRFPCGNTALKRIEWQSCEIFKAQPFYGPCKDMPSHSVTFEPATESDSSYRPTSDSDSDGPIPIRCHLKLCRKCNFDTDSYRRALSAYVRRQKYGPDELSDWYGHGDPDVDPNFPEYQEWIKKNERIALMTKFDETPDEDRFKLLNPSETWRDGECGLKTKDGEPIEKVDRWYQWAAKARLRDQAWAKKLEEREESFRVELENRKEERKRAEEMGAMEGVVEETEDDLWMREKKLEERLEALGVALKKEMEEKKWAQEMIAMEGVEETEGDCMCLDGAYEQETGGKSGEHEEYKWEKAMAMSLDSLASLSL